VSSEREFFDVWKPSSYPDEVTALLTENADLIMKYYRAEDALLADKIANRIHSGQWRNEYSTTYSAFIEGDLQDLMECQSLRAWHYSRLIDDEVDELLKNGVKVCSEIQMRKRLEEMRARGLLSKSEVTAISASSPLNYKEQIAGRVQKFWMTTVPMNFCDPSVEDLVGHWGGEVVYSYVEDLNLIEKLRSIGSPRVVEIKVPLSQTSRVFEAARSVAKVYAAELLSKECPDTFDIYTKTDLPKCHVLAVHSDTTKVMKELENIWL